MTRSLVGVIAGVVTALLIGAAVLAPAGRLTQILGLGALVALMVTSLIVLLTGVEFISRRLAHGSGETSAEPEKP